MIMDVDDRNDGVSEPIENNIESKWPGTTEENCRGMVAYARTRNPMVKFMIEKLEEVRLVDPPVLTTNDNEGFRMI